MREPCTKCGMIANLDPSLHARRYRHNPSVRRGWTVTEEEADIMRPCERCDNPATLYVECVGEPVIADGHYLCSDHSREFVGGIRSEPAVWQDLYDMARAHRDVTEFEG